MARVDKILPKHKLPEYYSDLPVNLDRNLVTGQIARVTNDDAIKQALINTILTNKGERIYQPWIGGDITKLLFETFDSEQVTADRIKERIQKAASIDPRVEIQDVSVALDEDNNEFNVRIVFSSLNIQQPQELEITISRVR